MSSLGHLTAYIGMNTAELRRDTAQAQGMLGRFSASGRKSIGAITASVGKLSAAFAGLGVVLGGGMLLRSIDQIGTDFEQTMATVGGVMRATSDELDALTESARRMGETTEWTASQAGESLRFLGMAGFEAGQAIEALPGTLDLATAGGLDLGRAADIATNALTAMQLPIRDLTRVNDVFVGTITRSNTNMEEMAEAFKYGAPVANAFGYSVEELSGMIGTLGNAGIKGSMAGTQLAMAIQKANDIAEEFGYSSSDLIDVLEQMNREGRSSAEFMDLFGLRAGRAALVLKDMIQPTREFQETLRGVSGEAETLAQKMRETIGGAKKELGSVFESIKIDIFEVFRDDLKDSITSITAWLRQNREEIAGFAKILFSTFKPLASVIGVLTARFGELMSAVGSLSGQTFESFMSTSKAMKEQQGRALELADQYDRLTRKTNLNASEQEDLKEVIADLAKLYPGMVTEVDKYGKALSVNTNLLRDEIEMQKALQAIRETERLKDIKDSYDDLYSARYENIEAMQYEYEYLSRQHQAAKNTVARLVDAGQRGSSAYWELKESAEKYARQMESMRERIAETSNAQDLFLTQASAMLPGLKKGTEQWKLAVQSLGEEFVNMVMEYQRALQDIGDDTENTFKTMEEAVDDFLKKGKSLNEIVAFINKFELPSEGGKPVSGSTLGGAEETTDKLLDAQADLYRDLLSETDRTTQQLEAIWEGYKSARMDQIASEAHELMEMGARAEEILGFYNKAMRDLRGEREDIFGFEINTDLINTQVNLYRDMVHTQGQARDEMLRAWSKYKQARMRQIDEEARHLRSIGASAEMVTDFVNNTMKDMTEEQKRIFGDHGDWMKQWMVDVAQSLRWIMADMFFDALKGDFVKLRDYLESFWDAFLRRMSAMAADELIGRKGENGEWSGLLGAIGGLFRRGGGEEAVPAMATGGIVTSPTLAQIGEVPEAVIPLHKLRDEQFMRSLGAEGSRENGEGDVTVHFHIQTPDVSSFKQSQQQLMTQAAVAMRQARRNL